jgi:hypothetical protein
MTLIHPDEIDNNDDTDDADDTNDVDDTNDSDNTDNLIDIKQEELDNMFNSRSISKELE